MQSLTNCSKSVSVNFSDIEPPKFEFCPGDLAPPNPGEYAMPPEWDIPTAIDNSGEKPTVTCEQLPASTRRAGYTLVWCTAIDAYGNEEMCQFTGKDKLRNGLDI